MNPSAEPLFQAVRDPERVASIPPDDWNRLLWLARRCALVSRLGSQIERSGRADRLPARVQSYFRAVAAVAGHHRRSVRWEMDRVGRALRGVAAKTVLLKGAAYVMADLPVAQGRLVKDVDILVPRASLEAVEQALRSHGWEPLTENEYDDYYYRAWMHELPPLRHRDRRAVIDVHHTILPPTGRLHPDPQRLFDSARPIQGGDFYVLAPEDMVLHAAAHLFQDGDLVGGLRDLTDLDVMFRHFAESEDGFWRRLVPRAEQLQLTRPLYYALRYARDLWQTPVPEEVAAAVERSAPVWPLRRLMDALVMRVLIPSMEDGTSWTAGLAGLALYVRSHWLRMPPRLLARHLARKALRRYVTRPKDES
jgi:hypothetical protein